METNGEFYFLSQLPAPSPGGRFVFFDVGANVGEYSQAILKRFPDAEGHLFDPLPSCAERLSSAFGENKTIRINNIAVSDVEGSQTIWLSNPQDSQASFYRVNSHEEALPLEVKTLTLEHYIEAEDIHHIHLLKVDVEGHELNVLTGMGKYLRPDFLDLVQFEYAGVGGDSRTTLHSLYQLLESRGFGVCKLMPRGLWKRAYYPVMDNFQYANYVAVSPEILPLSKQ